MKRALFDFVFSSICFFSTLSIDSGQPLTNKLCLPWSHQKLLTRLLVSLPIYVCLPMDDKRAIGKMTKRRETSFNYASTKSCYEAVR